MPHLFMNKNKDGNRRIKELEIALGLGIASVTIVQ